MYLADTHALSWTFQNAPDLSPRARDIFAGDPQQIMASAVSVYEVEFKVQRGQLPRFPASLRQLCDHAGFRWLPVLPAHAERAGRLPLTHRDPWDRILEHFQAKWKPVRVKKMLKNKKLAHLH